MKAKTTIFLITILTLIFLTGCAVEVQKKAESEQIEQTDNTDTSSTDIKTERETIDDLQEDSEQKKTDDWRSFELTDIEGKKTFKINEIDNNVILESFAVWCPSCTKQQREYRRLLEDGDTAVEIISINTDPNEEDRIIRQHREDNGFFWTYVNAPAEFTKMLIDEFGFGIVSAPSVPEVIICKDKTTHFIKGNKKKDTLKNEIQTRCG